MKTDFLIVGQGLAGSLLAWHLVRRGRRILVVDRDEVHTSSKVAAGLVNPVTGARFHIDDEGIDRLFAAKRFYWEAEETTGERFFHHVRIARLFQSEKERDTWEDRRDREDSRLPEFCESLSIDRGVIVSPHGGFETRESGWLDVPLFLEATRQWLLKRAAYAIGTVRAEDVVARGDGVRWRNVEAGTIIFAEGWRGSENPFFEGLTMNSAAGDILTLRLPGLASENRILHRGKWLVPLGEGLFRYGASYRHEFDSDDPSETSRRELEEALPTLTPLPFETIDHQAGIRPIIRRSQVFAGPSPAYPRVMLFNGLGSRGVLNGPWHADRFAAHLTEEAPLPQAMDLREILS